MNHIHIPACSNFKLYIKLSHWNSPRHSEIAQGFAEATEGFSLFASAIKIAKANLFTEYVNELLFFPKHFPNFVKLLKNIITYSCRCSFRPGKTSRVHNWVNQMQLYPPFIVWISFRFSPSFYLVGNLFTYFFTENIRLILLLLGVVLIKKVG